MEPIKAKQLASAQRFACLWEVDCAKTAALSVSNLHVATLKL